MFKLIRKETELNHDVILRKGGVILIQDKCWLVTEGDSAKGTNLVNLQCMEVVTLINGDNTLMKLIQEDYFWFSDFTIFENHKYDVRYIEPENVTIKMEV